MDFNNFFALLLSVRWWVVVLLPLISVQAKPPPSGRVEGKILLGPSAAEVDGKGVEGSAAFFFHADEPSIRLFFIPPTFFGLRRRVRLKGPNYKTDGLPFKVVQAD